MERYNHHIIVMLLLSIVLTSTFCCCKANKEISKRGVVEFDRLVFEKTTVIDEDLYKKSIHDIGEKLKEDIRKTIIDTTKNNSEEMELKASDLADLFVLFLPDLFDNGMGLYHYKVQDSLIISYSISNDELNGNYMVINKSSNTFHYTTQIDSLPTRFQPLSYQYRDENNLNVKEYRNEKKTIQGIECFKITVTVQDNLKEEGMPEVLRNAKTEYTMFVTDKIRSPYHPIIYYKSILDNYYPLEIIESIKEIKGLHTIYELKEILVR